MTQKLKEKIRNIPDFPKKGVLFKDITPALKDSETLHLIVNLFLKKLKGIKIDYVVGLEARGFILAPLIAYHLNAGFIPVRKPGKLPYKTLSAPYTLEYGTNELEIHQDSIEPGKKALILDDVLATGGSAAAVCELIKQLSGEIVGCAFLIELTDLGGRQKLPNNIPIITIIKD